MSEQPAETGAAPAPSNTYADPNAPVPAAPDDANAASDTITVDKGEDAAVTGVEQDTAEPEPEPAPEPDPRTLDADGNPVPDFFAPPETPPAHDPAVHGMAQRAIQAAGTGVLVKFEHVIMGVARFAHNHPELDRVFVQGLMDALSAVEKA